MSVKGRESGGKRSILNMRQSGSASSSPSRHQSLHSEPWPHPPKKSARWLWRLRSMLACTPVNRAAVWHILLPWVIATAAVTSRCIQGSHHHVFQGIIGNSPSVFTTGLTVPSQFAASPSLKWSLPKQACQLQESTSGISSRRFPSWSGRKESCCSRLVGPSRRAHLS